MEQKRLAGEKSTEYIKDGMIIGLGTEALIFIFSAFEPTHAEVDWSKVYPELGDDFIGESSPKSKQIAAASGSSTAQQLDKVLQEGKVGPELVKSLGEGMKSMAESAKQMSNLSSAAVATNDYANNVKSLIEKSVS